MENRIVLLTVTTTDPLGKLLLPVPITFSSAGLEVLIPQKRE